MRVNNILVFSIYGFSYSQVTPLQLYDFQFLAVFRGTKLD